MCARARAWQSQVAVCVAWRRENRPLNVSLFSSRERSNFLSQIVIIISRGLASAVLFALAPFLFLKNSPYHSGEKEMKSIGCVEGGGGEGLFSLLLSAKNTQQMTPPEAESKWNPSNARKRVHASTQTGNQKGRVSLNFCSSRNEGQQARASANDNKLRARVRAILALSLWRNTNTRGGGVPVLCDHEGGPIL